MGSGLHERLALNKNKNELLRLSTREQLFKNPVDAMKFRYILEFLDLDEDHRYSESDLETAIINKLEQFMLELGKGFLFEGRQKRITLNDNHYYVDLSFYNRLPKCFVLIDLKIGKLTHQDFGQMQMYKAVDEFTLPENNKQIYSKEYKLYLPLKKDLKKQLEL